MKVKVVGKTYLVNFVDRKELPNDYGECNNETQIIRVRKDNHGETQADVLLHEIIHAVDFAVNSDMTERQVHSIATGLLQVILDNPEIVKWIQKQKKNT